MDWLEQLGSLSSAEDRRAFLCARTLPANAAEQIHATLLTRLYSDLPQAERLADACEAVADIHRDVLSRAFAARSQGHVQHLRGFHEAAVGSYRLAASLFEQEGAVEEVGRTLSSGLQALSYLGRYAEAREWTDRAEAIFLGQGDVLRLARLDSNVGNIHFRQDRPADARARYERALEGFRDTGSATDIVAVLSNLAVCQTNLGNFTEALDCYRKARQHAEEAGLPVLAAQADYNIAFLHYQRGDYREAQRLYQLTRQICRTSGDAYHDALCDLDEAEMSLELNLTTEGESLARAAARKFEKLGMRYEQAKALVSLAVAGNQAGKRVFSDRMLLAARRLFVTERNSVWTALVDQLRAVLAFHGGRLDRALRLSTAAWKVLTKTMVPGRAAHSQILMARLWLRAGHADRARAVSREAVALLGDDISPSLRFHASLLEGEIHEAQGQWQEAWVSYQSARREIEDLRGRVETDDLRISVLKDKVSVYEALIALCVNPPAAALPFDQECALEMVQEAKSRSLADRTRVSPSVCTSGSGGSVDQRRSVLQQDLHWLYRNLDAATGVPSEELRTRVRSLEAELQAIDPRRTADAAADRKARLGQLQAVIPPHAALLEYFEARGSLYVFVISRDAVEHSWLGSSTPSRKAARLLHFQLGKFRTGLEQGLSTKHMDALQDHLRELHRMLIGPIEPLLQRFRHLILAPHRYLHSIPFAALNNGPDALIDRFTLSSIPSAQVFLNCRSRPAGGTGAPAVMAVPDAKAPEISQEGWEVRDALPGASLALGREASIGAFRERAASARILHLATHGYFRRDNPLYSSLQFGDGKLNLAEIQEIPIVVRLLTLSACNSGSAVAVGADELLGLMRGFLTAGARSLLLALWEVNDQSTREFMQEFYSQLKQGRELVVAHANATKALRAARPHPYHWAPFLLVGDPEALSA